MNSWRGTHNGKRIHRAYASLWGDERADAVANKLPPRPLKGRWGQASLTEAALLRCGMAELPMVFDDALQPERLERLPAGPASDLDLGAVDKDSEEYPAKVKRWVSEASIGLHNPDFWRTCLIANTARSPTCHLQN